MTSLSYWKDLTELRIQKKRILDAAERARQDQITNDNRIYSVPGNNHQQLQRDDHANIDIQQPPFGHFSRTVHQRQPIIENDQDLPGPVKRWGHTCVEALNRMFIIGGYCGHYLEDIWLFDFRTLTYQQVDVEPQVATPASLPQIGTISVNSLVHSGPHSQQEQSPMQQQINGLDFYRREGNNNENDNEINSQQRGLLELEDNQAISGDMREIRNSQQVLNPNQNMISGEQSLHNEVEEVLDENEARSSSSLNRSAQNNHQAELLRIKTLLQRSNHTSVFYKPHNAIYIFGGGHSQKKRFNDTLKLQLPYISSPFDDMDTHKAGMCMDSNEFMDHSKIALMGNKIVQQKKMTQNFDTKQIEKSKQFPYSKKFCSDERSEVASVSDHRLSDSDSQSHKWIIGLSEFFVKDNVSLNNGEEQIIPSARTYHASTLVDKYMVVVGGESNSSDLNDLWTLDLELKKWIRPEIHGIHNFMPKRFHTANTIQATKVITFGGCHSEYIHMNELNIFDMNDFLVSPNQSPIICTKVMIRENLPSTRWGHAASVMDDDKLIILGGRNDQDINDIHCFNIKSMSWREIKVGHPIPKPRRRLSCILVSNSLVMFGGFDSEFYNDLHALNLDMVSNQQIEKKLSEQSSKDSDYESMIDKFECSNFVLRVIDSSTLQQRDIHANKSLVLYRLIEKEVPLSTRLQHLERQNQQLNQKETQFSSAHTKICQSNSEKPPLSNQTINKNIDLIYPKFIQKVIDLNHGGVLKIEFQNDNNDNCQKVFRQLGLEQCMNPQDSSVFQQGMNFQQKTKTVLRLLEFLYIGKFHSKMTLKECLEVSRLSFLLAIDNTATEIADICAHIFHKFKTRLDKDFQIKRNRSLQGLEQEQADQILARERSLRLDYIFNNQIIDFQALCNDLENSYRNVVLGSNSFGAKENDISDSFSSNQINILSPEEQRGKTQTRKIQQMRICMNLDEFYDVVFQINEVNDCDYFNQPHLDRQTSYIKGNSVVLRMRSEYFRAMFELRQSHTGLNFREHSSKITLISKTYSYQQYSQTNQFRLVEIDGIPKIYFNCIIQYLYSDSFYLSEHSIQFFLRLMIYADYFMITRLVQICSNYIKKFITQQNVLSVLLIAHAHNSSDLENFCINFICLNEAKILPSREWTRFKKYTCSKMLNSHDQVQSMFEYYLARFVSFKSDNFVQHSIEQFTRQYSKVSTIKIEPSANRIKLNASQNHFESQSSQRGSQQNSHSKRRSRKRNVNGAIRIQQRKQRKEHRQNLMKGQVEPKPGDVIMENRSVNSHQIPNAINDALSNRSMSYDHSSASSCSESHWSQDSSRFSNQRSNSCSQQQKLNLKGLKGSNLPPKSSKGRNENRKQVRTTINTDRDDRMQRIPRNGSQGFTQNAKYKCLDYLDIESLLHTLSYVFIKNHAPVSMYDSPKKRIEEEKNEQDDGMRENLLQQDKEQTVILNQDRPLLSDKSDHLNYHTLQQDKQIKETLQLQSDSKLVDQSEDVEMSDSRLSCKQSDINLSPSKFFVQPSIKKKDSMTEFKRNDENNKENINPTNQPQRLQNSIYMNYQLQPSLHQSQFHF